MMINTQGKIKFWPDIKNESVNIQWLLYYEPVTRLKEIMSTEDDVPRNGTGLSS